MDKRTFGQILTANTIHHGSRLAIVEGQSRWTYGEFGARVQRLASVLVDKGLSPGDRFAVFAKNSRSFEELRWAGFVSGIVPVAVNWRLAPPEIEHVLADSGCDTIFLDSEFVDVFDHPTLRNWQDGMQQIGPELEASIIQAAPAKIDHEIDPDSDAMLFYTGGTTGRSKGVRLSHWNIISCGMAFGLGIRPRSDDVFLHAAPMFHSADLLATAWFLNGAAHCYLPAFSPAGFLQCVAENKVNATVTVPAMLMAIVGGNDLVNADISSIKTLIYGASPMAFESMTLWTAVSGWAAPALLFVVCRRSMDVTWSLAVTLIFLTTPALIYGGGSGQVEARTAMFVLVAGIAVSDALRTGLVRYAALAGFAVGFFIGSKYFGCIFALGCGLVILLQRRWFSHGAILTLVAAAMGGEWYVWNWLHTGDPFFPTLFGVLEYTDPLVWDEAHQGAFRELYSRLETPFPANPWWFAAYPFAATLAGPAIIESGRTGLGPFGLLVFPFVIAGVWCYRKRLLSSPLAPIAAIVFLFYAFWFISDTSQRVRQLLPVYPLFLICASVAALRWAEKAGTIGPLAGAVAVTAGLQLAVHGLFAINYAKYIFTNEDRTAFLTRNVPNFAPVPWINRELTGNNLVFLYERPLIYHFDVPVYYGHPINQVLINVVPGNKDFQGFLKQLRAKSVDHLLMPFPIPRDPTVPGKSGGYGLVQELLDRECVEIRQRFETRRVASRTLPALNQRVGSFALLRMKKNACPVASNGKAGK